MRKGCEYCTGVETKSYAAKEVDGISYYLGLVKNNVWAEMHDRSTGKSYIHKAAIAYCPMCGRKL